MATDLVHRLRNPVWENADMREIVLGTPNAETMTEAADRVVALETALREIVDAWSTPRSGPLDPVVGAIERAEKLLQKREGAP